MSNINSIHMGSFNKRPVGTNGELKEDTKKKLEVLGIDPSSVTSEAEAKVKIKEAEAAQTQIDTKVLQGNEANPMQQVFSDAKELAEKIGVKVGTTEDIKEILYNLNERIRAIEEEVSEVKEEQDVVKALKEEFEGINATFEDALASQAKITGKMEQKATINKRNSHVNTSIVTKAQIQQLGVAQSNRKDSLAKEQELNEKLENQLLPENPEQEAKKVQQPKNSKDTKNDTNNQNNKPTPEEKPEIKEEFTGTIQGHFGMLNQKHFAEKVEEKPVDAPKVNVDTIKANEKKSDSVFINGVAQKQTSETVKEKFEAQVKRQELDDAKALAKRVGVAYDGISDISSIYTKINEKISAMEDAGDSAAVDFRLDYKTSYERFLRNQ